MFSCHEGEYIKKHFEILKIEYLDIKYKNIKKDIFKTRKTNKLKKMIKWNKLNE